MARTVTEMSASVRALLHLTALLRLAVGAKSGVATSARLGDRSSVHNLRPGQDGLASDSAAKADTRLLARVEALPRADEPMSEAAAHVPQGRAWAGVAEEATSDGAVADLPKLLETAGVSPPLTGGATSGGGAEIQGVVGAEVVSMGGMAAEDQEREPDGLELEPAPASVRAVAESAPGPGVGPRSPRGRGLEATAMNASKSIDSDWAGAAAGLDGTTRAIQSTIL